MLPATDYVLRMSYDYDQYRWQKSITTLKKAA